MDCNEAIRIKPDYAEAFYQRSLAYGRKNGWDSAISDCNEAIRITT